MILESKGTVIVPHFLRRIMMKYLPESEKKNVVRAEYETPAIIYEDSITTRAGSPLGNPSGVDGINPDDLFDN